MAYSEQQIREAMGRAQAAGAPQEDINDLRSMLAEALEAAAPNSAANPASESGTENFFAGVGQGMTNVGRQLGRLRPGDQSAEIERARQLDAPLLDTAAGTAGSFLGEAVATAPVGGFVGSAAKGAAARVGGQGLKKAVGSLMGQGAIQGGAEGALMSGGNPTGAAAGAVSGAVLPYSLGRVGRFVTRGVEASAPARRLMREGVDLTPGQMNPNSTLGQMEEALQNAPIVGPFIKSGRDDALAQWQDVVRKQGAAPGGASGPTLEDVYGGYSGAYEAGKGFPVTPENFDTGQRLASFPKAQGSIEQSVMNRGTYATDASRKTVNDWLQNQVTALPGKGKSIDTMDSADLYKLRSKIREQARKVKGTAPTEHDLLMNAERRVTEALESQLPPDALDAVRAADRQYAQYKVIEDATGRAGDQLEGMRPSHLSQAVKASVRDKGAYGRGGGGPLRELAGAGRQVFDQRTPPTGARLIPLITGTTGVTTMFGPAAPVAAAGALAGLAGTKFGRKVAGGATKPQQRATKLAAALRRGAGRGGRAATRAELIALGAQVGDEVYGE